MMMTLSRQIVKFRQHTANFLQIMRSARNALPQEALCSALIGCFRYLFQTEPPEKFEIIEEVTSKYMKVERMKCYYYYYYYYHDNRMWGVMDICICYFFILNIWNLIYQIILTFTKTKSMNTVCKEMQSWMLSQNI